MDYESVTSFGNTVTSIRGLVPGLWRQRVQSRSDECVSKICHLLTIKLTAIGMDTTKRTLLNATTRKEWFHRLGVYIKFRFIPTGEIIGKTELS